jgi:hypothetical protein
MKSIEPNAHEYQHTDFIYYVVSVTTNSSGIPTKDATNTLYPSMPEASTLGLGLGLRVYHVLASYNPPNDIWIFFIQQKEKSFS